ncbi:MAG: Stp1/IreP family PP2C-type Ser/Thr phosphatase [Ignavibacteriae bacterium]|nr:Stp1/IreP family PP2C-type Ser/Thr phosphatase [Ignavibacteriota bacterium]MCB9215550.1 Stp1/IreP family PP2C-type Ser/Thr phosphatase [Ignavibacteria bacterium]
MAEGREHIDRNSRRNLSVASRTHVGLRRQENQDYYVVRGNLLGGTLLVVADGMGGHKGGKEASQIAADTFVNVLERSEEISESALGKGMIAANSAVVERAEEDPLLAGMGTTLVAVFLQGESGQLINLGDSRAYRYRAGRLEQITRDHAVVAEMVARGELTPEEGANHPRRNVLSQAIGMKELPRPDYFPLTCELGDILLLCSDGLSGMVEDQDIEKILGTTWSLEAKGDSLIEAALDGGGRDNVTLILAEITEKNVGEEASGPPTNPGSRGESSGEEEKKKGFGAGGLILIGALAIGGTLWGSYQVGWIGGGTVRPDTLSQFGLDTNLLDSTWLEIDTTILQPTPGDGDAVGSQNSKFKSENSEGAISVGE